MGLAHTQKKSHAHTHHPMRALDPLLICELSGGSSIYFMNQRWMNKVASWKVQKEKDDLPLPQLYFLLRLYGTT
jgi:hypothetical protein